MVLFNAVTFISLVLFGTLCWSQTSQYQLPKERIFYSFRAQSSAVSFPQIISLSVSDGRSADIYAVSTGFHLAGEFERRSKRFSQLASLGVGAIGTKAQSDSSSIEYSYGAKPSTYIVGTLGVQYYTDKGVGVGLSGKTFYLPVSLPAPEGLGVEYSFKDNSALKSFISIDLRWFLIPSWSISQSMLIPLRNDLKTGWQLSLNRSF